MSWQKYIPNKMMEDLSPRLPNKAFPIVWRGIETYFYRLPNSGQRRFCLPKMQFCWNVGKYLSTIINMKLRSTIDSFERGREKGGRERKKSIIFLCSTSLPLVSTGRVWSTKWSFFTVRCKRSVLSINAVTSVIFPKKNPELWFKPRAAGFGILYAYHCAPLPPLFYISLKYSMWSVLGIGSKPKVCAHFTQENRVVDLY